MEIQGSGLKIVSAAPLAAGECEDCEKEELQKLQEKNGRQQALTEETVKISEEGRAALEESNDGKDEDSTNPGAVEKSFNKELNEEEKKVVQELRARDQEVRAHENAHKAAAGGYATGGPTYTYQTGPDGKRYAIGGEVQIDTSEVPNDPEATIRKAQVIRRAALAPAEPSGQDQKVASQARAIENRARQELAKERREETQEKAEETAETSESSLSSVSGENAGETSGSSNENDSGSGQENKRNSRLIKKFEPDSASASGQIVDQFF
jgi:hypothetical protein